MKVVLDTSFLSSLFKVGRLHLVRDFFNDSIIHIPTAVLKEISSAYFFRDFVSLVCGDEKEIDKMHWIIVKEVKAEQDIDLGSGEREAISMAKNLRGVLLIDDGKARERAFQRGIKCFDLPSFLLAVKISGLLDNKEMKKIIEDLKKKDYYSFRKDIESELLR